MLISIIFNYHLWIWENEFFSFLFQNNLMSLQFKGWEFCRWVVNIITPQNPTGWCLTTRTLWTWVLYPSSTFRPSKSRAECSKDLQQRFCSLSSFQFRFQFVPNGLWGSDRRRIKTIRKALRKNLKGRWGFLWCSLLSEGYERASLAAPCPQIWQLASTIAQK